MVTITSNQTIGNQTITSGAPPWIADYALNKKQIMWYNIARQTANGAERLASESVDTTTTTSTLKTADEILPQSFNLLGPFSNQHQQKRRRTKTTTTAATTTTTTTTTTIDNEIIDSKHHRRQLADPLTTIVGVSFPGLSLERNFFVALSAGFMIGVLVFALGSISGANLNPAVTIGLAVTQKMSSFRATCYVGAQCAGSTVGALFVRSLAPTLFIDAGGGMNGFTPSRDIGTWTVVGGEMLGTAVLVFVVCAAADVGREKNNKYQGAMTPLMIGFAVMVAHIFLIPVDGCSINPARSFGAALASGNFNDQWLFWFGPLLGGAGAALIYSNLFAFVTPPTVLPSTRNGAGGGGGGGGGVQTETLAVGPQNVIIQQQDIGNDATQTSSTSREDRLGMARGEAGTMAAAQRPGTAWNNKLQGSFHNSAEQIQEFR
jgi:MIP family channel proteins